MSWSPANRSSGFRPGRTQTGLKSHRRTLEAWNFGFKKKRNCTILVAKTNGLISCAVTAQLICAFVFAKEKSLVFSRRGSYNNHGTKIIL